MKKQKSIRRQLKNFYLKNSKQFSRTERWLFKLLLLKLGKKRRANLLVLGLKLLKYLISIVSTCSRPGSLLFLRFIHEQCEVALYSTAYPNALINSIRNSLSRKKNLANRNLTMMVHTECVMFPAPLIR